MADSATALHRLPAHRLGELIARREVSSEEAVRSCLEWIAKRDAEVRAWAFLDSELALAQARARDAEEPAGPLHGVPAGIKDVIDTADMPTEMGTVVHRGRRPGADAACVARLRAAGVVILGKTVTTEFATKPATYTTNPHDSARTPGGSSSGSAAAVGGDMVPLALGTQTVGSTIRPATFCGAFGMKPTWARVDMTGINQTSARLDTIGLMAREATDIGLLLSALVPDAGDDAAATSEPPRLGFARTPWWDAADEDGTMVFERALEAARAGGAAAVDAIEFPAELANLVEVHNLITLADLAGCMASVYAQHRNELSDTLRDEIERGQKVTEAEYAAAVAEAERGRAVVDRFFDDYDALVVPAATGEAPLGLGSTGNPIFCRMWSLLGNPAIAVPITRGSHDMPLGVQVVGRHGTDTALVRIAGFLHAASHRAA
jgi:Asp-tRNA(Asn)/Glu-tRNA(Gln) amidotransferase A subunit family amidase